MEKLAPFGRSAKLEIIDNLKTRLPPPRILADSFSTEDFLFNLFEDSQSKCSNEIVRILDRLCKKVDVVRSLRAFYTPDLSKIMDKAYIHPPYIPFMMVTLLYFSEECNDPKFLNTALKLQSGILTHQDADFTPPLLEWATQGLERIV